MKVVAVLVLCVAVAWAVDTDESSLGEVNLMEDMELLQVVRGGKNLAKAAKSQASTAAASAKAAADKAAAKRKKMNGAASAAAAKKNAKKDQVTKAAAKKAAIKDQKKHLKNKIAGQKKIVKVLKRKKSALQGRPRVPQHQVRRGEVVFQGCPAPRA